MGVDRYESLGRGVNPNTFLEGLAGNFLSALNTRGSLQEQMQVTEREKEGYSGASQEWSLITALFVTA